MFLEVPDEPKNKITHSMTRNDSSANILIGVIHLDSQNEW